MGFNTSFTIGENFEVVYILFSRSSLYCGHIVNLEVELTNGATICEFDAEKTPTFNANKTSADVSLGDPQSAEQRDVLMDIQLPAWPDLGTDGDILNYASVTLSYFSVITIVVENVTADLLVSLNYTGNLRPVML